MLILILGSCKNSDSMIATAISETETAKPTITTEPTSTLTPTPEPTTTPTPTTTPIPTETPIPIRETAFSSSYTSVKEFLSDFDFEHSGISECLLNGVPIWGQCDNFVYLYKDDLSQIVQVVHDGESVVGEILVFTNLPEKYPDEVTLGITITEFVIRQNLPTSTLFSFTDTPTRYDNFVYYEHTEGEYRLKIWLDLELAKQIFD